MLFIRRVLLSAAVFIAFLAMFDYPYSKMTAGSNYSPIEAWNYVMGGDIDADLVVLGNSRASSNYETRVLDSLLGIRSHDIAIKGCGIYEQSYMYDLFRRLNRKPRALLINVDHVSLVRNDKIPYREQFFPWFYSKDFREVVFPRERFSLAEKYMPMWRWVGYNPLSFIKRFPRTTFHGFEPHIRSMNFVFSRYKHGPLRFYYYDPEVMETWKDMLDRTLADSIKVAFAFSPMYSDVVYAKGEEERLHEVIDSLAGSYGIPVLDYSHSPICSDSTLFHDFNHLNQNGAVVYSDSIARDLSQLGFFD